MAKKNISKILNSGSPMKKALIIAEHVAREKYGFEGILTDKEFNTYLEGTPLKQKTVTEAEVLFAHTFFNPLIKLYKLYYRMPFSRLFIGITDSFFCFKYKPHKLMVNTYKLSKKIFYGLVTFLHNYFPRLYVKLRAVYIGRDKLKQRMARKVKV